MFWKQQTRPFLVMMLTFCVCSRCSPLTCPRGEYVYTPTSGPEICRKCTPGVTYMPDDRHSHRQCYDCTHLRDPDLEVFISECNITHDAVILCTPGYYRLLDGTGGSGRCVKCSECKYPARACGGVHDTVCCWSPDYDVIPNQYGNYVCQLREVVCGPGEFVDSKLKKCLPCPPNTFMSKEKHNRTLCNKCQTTTDLRSHQVLLQPCDSIHPTVIGCEEGYFMNPTQQLNEDDVTCSPCTTCEYEGRPCDMYHDSVCCQHARMQVIDTDDGSKCVPYGQLKRWIQPHGDTKFTFCGLDHFLKKINDSARCQPCPRGTYVDEAKHTRPECKNCTDFTGQYLVPVSCTANGNITAFVNSNTNVTCTLSHSVVTVTECVLFGIAVAYFIIAAIALIATTNLNIVTKYKHLLCVISVLIVLHTVVFLCPLLPLSVTFPMTIISWLTVTAFVSGGVLIILSTYTGFTYFSKHTKLD